MFLAICAKQGFRVKGWFKPGTNEDETLSESFSIHVCYLMPADTLTEDQKLLVHGAESGTVFANCFTVHKLSVNVSYLTVTSFLRHIISISVMFM